MASAEEAQRQNDPVYQHLCTVIAEAIRARPMDSPLYETIASAVYDHVINGPPLDARQARINRLRQAEADLASAEQGGYPIDEFTSLHDPGAPMRERRKAVEDARSDCMKHGDFDDTGRETE